MSRKSAKAAQATEPENTAEAVTVEETASAGKPVMAPAEDEYSLKEMIAAARTAFGVNPEVVAAALRNKGKTSFTVREAKSLITRFLERKVQ